IAGNATTPFDVRVEWPPRLATALASPQPAPAMPWLSPEGIAVVAVGGTVGVAAWIHRRRPFPFALLFSRIASSAMLAHPQRRRMRDAIAANPGIGVNELQRELGLAKGVFDHHLHRLVSGGHVRAAEDGQRRRLYVAGAALPPPGAPTLRERTLHLLETRGEMRAADVARELGVSRQALHHHLKRLAKDG